MHECGMWAPVGSVLLNPTPGRSPIIDILLQLFEEGSDRFLSLDYFFLFLKRWDSGRFVWLKPMSGYQFDQLFFPALQLGIPF